MFLDISSLHCIVGQQCSIDSMFKQTDLICVPTSLCTPSVVSGPQCRQQWASYRINETPNQRAQIQRKTWIIQTLQLQKSIPPPRAAPRNPWKFHEHEENKTKALKWFSLDRCIVEELKHSWGSWSVSQPVICLINVFSRPLAEDHVEESELLSWEWWDWD